MAELLDLEAVNLFGGPGGTCLGAKSVGIDPLGIEWDDAACATREAAGLRTLQADVAALNPLDFAPCELQLGSPPCPTFSRAGKGDGIADMPLVYEAATAAARGKPVPPLPWRDERSALVVEPLRWAILLEPRFLAWEQVPDVLPFWEHCAELLRSKGWNVWTGVMEAERYGVPQTRERAILMADREQPVHPPRPTHQRYVKGEEQRHEVTMDGEILPWVSMAEALGWGMTERPYVSVRTAHGTGHVYGGSGAKATIEGEEEAGRWVCFRNGNRENAAERPASEPAPTLHFGGRSNKVDWVLRSGRSVAGGDRAEREAGEPAVTITSRADNNAWVGRNWGGGGPTPAERPATTVAGDPRLSSPTHHNHGEQNAHAIRVTLEEAAILQSFPPDYPFQGTKSKRFEQVGNAVPPLLAHAILSALLAPVLEAELKVAA